MHFLTCVSFIVADESFGEEPDHESCRPEKRKERGLALAQEVRLASLPQPPPSKTTLREGQPPSETPALQRPGHNGEGLGGTVNYGSVQLEGSFGPPPLSQPGRATPKPARRQTSFLTLKAPGRVTFTTSPACARSSEPQNFESQLCRLCRGPSNH